LDFKGTLVLPPNIPSRVREIYLKPTDSSLRELSSVGAGTVIILNVPILGMIGGSTKVPLKSKFHPGGVYVWYRKEEKKYFLAQLGKYGTVERILGELEPGSVIRGESLGSPQKNQNFRLQKDGKWYATDEKPNLIITLYNDYSSKRFTG